MSLLLYETSGHNLETAPITCSFLRTTKTKSTTNREAKKSHQIRRVKGNLPQSMNFTGSAQVNAIKQHRTMNPLWTSMFPFSAFGILPMRK